LLVGIIQVTSDVTSIKETWSAGPVRVTFDPDGAGGRAGDVGFAPESGNKIRLLNLPRWAVAGWLGGWS
jgi:hypothetical protein